MTLPDRLRFFSIVVPHPGLDAGIWRNLEYIRVTYLGTLQNADLLVGHLSIDPGTAPCMLLKLFLTYLDTSYSLVP